MNKAQRIFLGTIRSVWPYLLMVGILLGSSYEIATAGQNTPVVDTCNQFINTCTALDQSKERARKEYDQAQVLAQTSSASYVTYRIVFQGELEAATDTDQFINQVAQTLAHSNGWSRAGYVFNRVQSASQADFSLTLVQAELLDDIPGCSSQWSCRSGSNVYVNENRWNSATPAWNGAGGNLRDYRHMVVNHEVGHWLGHGHYSCSDSPNNKAPVMQQQSINLQGCQFNPWPLQFEIDAV